MASTRSRGRPPRLPLRLALALALGVPGAAAGRAGEPAADAGRVTDVRVVAEESPGRFGGATYRYVVINNSSAPVTSVLIGFDGAAGVSELLTPPLGWDGTEAPPTSFTSPDGWRFSVTRTEEDSVMNLTWQIEDPSSSLWTGTRLTGFSVTLPREDTLYESGHWTAILSSGPRPSLSGRIEKSPHRRSSSIADDPGIHVRHDASWASATIEYEMDDPLDVEVSILAEGGSAVRSLFHDQAHAGKNKVVWDGLDDDGRGVTPGTYYVRVRTEDGDRYARFSWLR